MLSISHEVDRYPGQRYERNTDGRHRPVALEAARRGQAQDRGNRENQQHNVLYYYSDEFEHLPVLQFPIRNHFHVSKADNDRKLIEALGQRTRAYAMIAAVAVLSITAIVGTGAFVALDRAEAARRV